MICFNLLQLVESLETNTAQGTPFYLKFAGYKDIKVPRPCITQMAQDGMLDPSVWEDLLLARNELSHIYDEAKSRKYLDKIILDYFPAVTGFKNKMSSKL